MCLAVPGEVIEILTGDELIRPARVRFGSISREVSLAFAPEAGIGDFVLVHAGVAIARLGPAEAAGIEATLAEAFEAFEASGSGPERD